LLACSPSSSSALAAPIRDVMDIDLADAAGIGGKKKR
jgi:hypothetical protein